MNFRKIFNLDKSKNEPSQQLPDGHQLVKDQFSYDLDDFRPDQLGQGIGRFIYNSEVLHKAHSVDYETAFQTLNTFKKIATYRGQMAFWQKNPTVFGYACIIVFDTHQKEYWPYYGRPYRELNSDLSEPEGRYERASIIPDNIEEFHLFWEWCVKNYLSEMSTTVLKESSHWEEIKTLLSPSDYINGCLVTATAEVENNDKLPAISSQNLYTDEQAKQYFFFFGNKEATWGKVDNFFDVPDMYTVLHGVITCPLSTYAEIISRYKFGYDMTVRIAFLKKQQERLNKGEDEDDIRLPTSQYQDVVVEQLRSLLKSSRKYDSLKDLSQLPWFQDIKPEAPDYNLVFRLINKYHLGGSIIDEDGKLMNAFLVTWKNFFYEYKRQLEVMSGDKIGRTTYIKNVISKLYIPTDEYICIDKLYHFLCPDKLEEYKVPLNDKFVIEIDQIRTILFHCRHFSFIVSAMLERDLQVEGITIKDGWIMCKQVDPREDAAEQPQVVIDIDSILKETNSHSPNLETLDGLENSLESKKATAKENSVKQAQLALFYYYCHEKKCLPAFVAGQMVQSYKDATKPYNLAWKPFQQLYNRFKDRSNRLALENRSALKAAVRMLEKHPKALELAQDELKTAETRNPLT